MHLVSKLLIGFVAAIHVYIMTFEMFLWESRGPKVFSDFPVDLFAETKVLAANQGLYNAFLAAGLIWALLFVRSATWKRNIALFFLSCVVVAGLFGGITASASILAVQALPAVLALLSVVVLDSKGSN